MGWELKMDWKSVVVRGKGGEGRQDGSRGELYNKRGG